MKKLDPPNFTFPRVRSFLTIRSKAVINKEPFLKWHQYIRAGLVLLAVRYKGNLPSIQWKY